MVENLNRKINGYVYDDGEDGGGGEKLSFLSI